MACFYVGFNYFRRKNGIFKQGVSRNNTPSARLSTIRQKEHFQCLAWIQMPTATWAELLAVESDARVEMSYLYKNIQNDHFLYQIMENRKYEQAQAIAKLAIQFAIESCERRNIPYKIGTKEYKRG